MNKTDQKITLCKIKFNLGACKELSKKEIDSLSETARDFFLFHSSVRNKIKIEKFCQYLGGRRQNTGLRLRHVRNMSAVFLRKLVQSDKNSKIQNKSKLKKTAVETLLNELFYLNDRENEINMEEYADELGVKISV